MQRPFDMEVVDAMVARALTQALGIQLPESVNPPIRSEVLAARILISRADVATHGYDGTVYVCAGFRLAIRLCCRILAEPFSVHRGGAKRDVNAVMTWLNRSREA